MHYVCVNLSRVRLTGHVHRLVKAHFGCDEFVKRFDLFTIAVKELKKTCRRTRRTLATQQSQARKFKVKCFKVYDEVLKPERCTLADRCRLCRLEVCVAKRCKCFMFVCKIANFRYKRNELASHELQCFTHNDNIGVVANVATRCAQMNDWLCLWANFAVCKHVRHNVVAYFPFLFTCKIIVDIVDICLHLGDLLVLDVNAELLFCFGERNPKPAPSAKLEVLRKNMLHFVAGIPFRKRRNIFVLHIGPHNKDFTKYFAKILYNVIIISYNLLLSIKTRARARYFLRSPKLKNRVKHHVSQKIRKSIIFRFALCNSVFCKYLYNFMHIIKKYANKYSVFAF